ncbi:MAG: VWA domain-containing protein [Nitrososphaerota archaeon]|nr:VWA domain-containing protein [Nitrososphaerota archaeon]MDG7012792.1 VWA domain-containing protein [Nitrososphaerota archaeon]MDG7026698.1 VWA domain-containing protein [Nitrososphaerota archaeon]
MNILEYAWTNFSSVSGVDQSRFRLVLSETSARPAVGLEGEGFVVKVPVPRKEKEGVVSVQGLFADADDQGWAMLWRLFRASLYHAAFHVAYGNLKPLARWAKGKERFPAIFTVSLLEDYRITLAAREKWPGVMTDVAYANAVGAMRMPELDDIENRGLRTSAKMLASLWGVSPAKGGRVDEDQAILALTEKVRGMVENSVEDPENPLLPKAADLVYSQFNKVVLPQIPAFPHTEAHSGDSLFRDHLEAKKGKGGPKLAGALAAIGVEGGGVELPDEPEFKDTFAALQDAHAKRQRAIEYYSKLMASTRLDGVSFPDGDYAAFLRARADLAGPIRNIKNQLLAIKNVADEEPGKLSGQVDIPMAMQVIASGSQRSDVFIREEPILKDEAWAILVDASRSVSKSSMEMRGIATCLAEVASAVMRERSRWALYGFNDSLQIVKDFDEPYSMEAKSRIGGLSQKGGTYLPDALSVASRALNSRPIESKYLVVVSDCLPTGYAGIEEELVEKVKDAGKMGVMLVGIGVESPEVKKYFKVNSVLDTPYEMMKFFTKAYMELSGAPES